MLQINFQGAPWLDLLHPMRSTLLQTSSTENEQLARLAAIPRLLKIDLTHDLAQGYFFDPVTVPDP